jgi:predicted alpha-1,2-mannosidase
MKSVGRLGVEHYNAKGYVPRDVGIKESAARTLEYAYDDWCIAALARAIGRPEEEVNLYATRARNWRNVFDPARRIAVGRNADGSFNADFDPFAWGGDFTEGCALHYTWSVFHDVEGLCAAMGGRKEFERRLDEIFTLPPKFTSTYYHTVIHEMREMQIMGFGQYAHGNQPIQHMIYLYDWTGAPEKAGRHARDVMDRLYTPTPDGYCGDEDNGQTSAWFVWSAMGLYPVCPGSGEYATGVPLFDNIDVALPNGRALEIRAPGAEARRFPAAPVPRIRRADLLKGGMVQFGAVP